MADQTRQKPSDEFQKFAELTKKLVRVPKKEIDRQKAAYEKKRERAKKSDRKPL